MIQAKSMSKKRILARDACFILKKNMNIVGKNIKYYRGKRGLTQNQLAWFLLTDRVVVARIESNPDYNPELLTLAKIAHVLEVELNDLFITEKKI